MLAHIKNPRQCDEVFAGCFECFYYSSDSNASSSASSASRSLRSSRVASRTASAVSPAASALSLKRASNSASVIVYSSIVVSSTSKLVPSCISGMYSIALSWRDAPQK